MWLDRDLQGHGSFTDAIERELNRAKAVLAIWSSDAAASEWVRAEANRGREARKLVQICVDGSPLPLPFDQIQCTDLRGWSGDPSFAAWGKVVESVATLVTAQSPGPTPSGAIARRQSTSTERLLAVLAFDNLSSDPEMGFFSDGVADEIQQTLARSPGVKVLARSSTFQFRGAQKAVRNVADQLNATHLLDGSVRRAGERVRINAQCVDCASGVTLWADSFNRKLDDIFALQDEIAEAVAKALAIVFSPPRGRIEMSIPTYELFLKAQSIVSNGTKLFDDSGAAATPLLEEVVREAPDHARAWELLAQCRAWTLRSGRRTGDYQLGRAGVLKAAETALGLDPSCSGALEAMAMLEPWGAYGTREALLEQALRVRPNDPSVLGAMSTFCWGVGRVREALRLAESACELNPLFPDARLTVAQMHTYVGNEAASIRMLSELHRQWPDNYSVLISLVSFSAHLGFWDAFDDAVPGIARFSGWQQKQLRRDVGLGEILRTGVQEPRQGILDYARRHAASDGYLPLNWIVELNWFGFPEEAMALAEESSFDHMFDPDGPMPAGQYPGVIFGSWFSLNREPRFVDIFDRVGLCRYWVETEHWPDCAEWLPYDLKAESRRRVLG